MAQRCLLAKREKWKQAVDNGQAFAELLTDLLKASDSLQCEVFVTELNAIGFCLKASKLMIIVCPRQIKEQNPVNLPVHRSEDLQVNC